MQVIKLENVSKRFNINCQISHRQKHAREFWALRNLNMEISKGRIIGIIGRNGAGKTTLLNILAGISTPTFGDVEINGRVSCLLTLGAGFQDELTGRENIYLNSSILGMSRNDINKKYCSIVEFSELDSFLSAPLQTYSQGMRLRLGFSVAIHMDFDILLIDEILSVGDVSFQKKCFEKIEEFRKQEKTMIITTQSLEVVERLCEEAYLLENGEVVQNGHPQKVAGRYLELLNQKSLPETFQQRYSKLTWWGDKSFWEKKEGSKEVRVVEVKTYNSYNRETNRFKSGERITVKVYFVVDKGINEPHFGIAIFREDGIYCYGPNTAFDGNKIQRLSRGEGFFSIEYKSLILRPGKYRFSIAIWDKSELWAYDYHSGFYKFEILGENRNDTLLNLKYKWRDSDWWRLLSTPEVDILGMLQMSTSGTGYNSEIASDIELSSVDLLGLSDEPKDIFNTGEDLKIKLRFKFLKEQRNYYIWLGLFRGDDVYCHGTSRRLREESVSLVYHEIPLLNGEYYLSVGIWEKGQRKILMYKHKASTFKMSFFGQDHGTVYLEHSWDWRLP